MPGANPGGGKAPADHRGLDGAAGIAPGLATDTKAAAFERTSSGVWLDGQEYSYHVMVHELGR